MVPEERQLSDNKRARARVERQLFDNKQALERVGAFVPERRLRRRQGLMGEAWWIRIIDLEISEAKVRDQEFLTRLSRLIFAFGRSQGLELTATLYASHPRHITWSAVLPEDVLLHVDVDVVGGGRLNYEFYTGGPLRQTYMFGELHGTAVAAIFSTIGSCAKNKNL